MGPSFMYVIRFVRLPDNDNDNDDDDKKWKIYKKNSILFTSECFIQCIGCSFSSVKILDSRFVRDVTQSFTEIKNPQPFWDFN